MNCARCNNGPVIVGDRSGNGGRYVGAELLCLVCAGEPLPSRYRLADVRWNTEHEWLDRAAFERAWLAGHPPYGQ